MNGARPTQDLAVLGVGPDPEAHRRARARSLTRIFGVVALIPLALAAVGGGILGLIVLVVWQLM
jgi:hypothetical protein